MPTNNIIQWTKDDLDCVTCPVCGSYIGEETVIDGEVKLDLGAGITLYSLHGWHQCNENHRAQLHWDAHDVIFKRLLRHINQRSS